MKIKLLLLSLMAGSVAHGALYTLTNGVNAAANGIGNSEGIAFQNSANATFAGPGVISFGIFSTDDFSGASTTDIVSAFTAWSGAGAFGGAGPVGNRGTFTSAAPAGLVAGSGFAGMNMYVLAGNGTSLANSTELLVLKTTFTFNAADDNVATPITNTITYGNSTVLFGGTFADIRTTNADASVTGGWRTVSAVPEPSIALLGALGIFGLIRRRR